uniref:Uncharacterized protein n=1 Tax=Rhizophora mucronata TaxID=61149 RepID=A0A2P2JBK6_RHIMU
MIVFNWQPSMATWIITLKRESPTHKALKL